MWDGSRLWMRDGDFECGWCAQDLGPPRALPARAMSLRARLETSSTCQSPAEDRFLTRFCRLVYTQGTQVPITPSQSSPAASRQRRPPIVTWFLSRTRHIPHTHIHTFIYSGDTLTVPVYYIRVPGRGL